MNPNANVEEYTASDKRMTNHQALKDREMQRAFDAAAEIPFLPTRSRARRAGTTQHRMIEYYKLTMEKTDAKRLPVPAAQN